MMILAEELIAEAKAFSERVMGREEPEVVYAYLAGAAIPFRVQRKRTKGWRMPPNTVYVGRPTIWGNPDETALFFEMWLRGDIFCDDAELNARREEIRNRIPELRGKNLACWCSLEQDCHADILLRLANE